MGFSATSRQEFIADLPISALNQAVILNGANGWSNDRFMYGMLLTVEGRITNPSGTEATGLIPEAPFSLIENINVTGFHRVRAQNEPFINVRGIDLYHLLRCYSNLNSYVEPNQPTLALLGQFVPEITVVADEVNDFRFMLYIPFTPLNMPINTQLGWLLDAPNYDRLQLTINVGDALSLFTGLAAGSTGVIGAATATQPGFTAYGSTTGTPRIRVEGQFALGGASAFGLVPGRVWRNFYENVTGDILQASAPNSRQFNVPRGNKIRSILMKTGVKATTSTATNNPFASLSDNIFTNIRMQRGLNKSIRFYPGYRSIKWETSQSYGMFPAPGYALLDFAQRGRLSEVLDTVGLVAGPSGDTDTFIQADVAGAANSAAVFLVEELRGIPRRIQAVAPQGSR
jgi:hypothetical protein